MKIKINLSELKYKYSKKSIDLHSSKSFEKINLFDKKKESKVISMLEEVMEELNLNDIESIHKLEDLIRYDLPSALKAKKDVFKWLISNYEF